MFSKVQQSTYFLSLAQKLLIGYYSFVTFIKTGLSKFFCTLRKLTFEKPVRPVLTLVQKSLEGKLWKCRLDFLAPSLWFINLKVGPQSAGLRDSTFRPLCTTERLSPQGTRAAPRLTESSCSNVEAPNGCSETKLYVLQFAGKLRLSKHELESKSETKSAVFVVVML